MTTPTLYHYTCEHGREGIGDKGEVRSIREFDVAAFATLNRRGLGLWALLSWFTDLDTPVREVLGLTSESITCDRTQYRYRVTDTGECEPWVGSSVRKFIGKQHGGFLERLELSGHALPMHWWVAIEPVPVVYDPIDKGG
jgi:hypothetical protein